MIHSPGLKSRFSDPAALSQNQLRNARFGEKAHDRRDGRAE
jgi:hypothetical protein